jgi:hypothetical protein
VWHTIGFIVLVAMFGSLLVPMTVVILSSFGLFEPIELFGWKFGKKK